MNILIVAACEFASNTAIHPLNVAQFMQRRGIECIVSFRSDDNNVRPKGPWQFRICDHTETTHNGVLFPDGRGPDLVHAWTPREHVRQVTERMVERYGCPYLVHLEDNEEVILADTLGTFDYSRLIELPARVTEAAISPFLSHPKRYRWFLDRAAGMTALIDKLMEFKPPSVPGVVFWPGFDEGILNAEASRRTFGLDENRALLVYNGNIHRSNEAEVSSLIDAAGLLHRAGVPVTLLKTGANHAALEKLKQAEEEGYLIDLGFVPRSDIQALLNIADVLVQPGHASPFNDYRFPCKLPEFLATGKPVILPESNLGRFLQDGSECLLMKTGTPEEIAAKVRQLLEDKALSERIGKSGKEFAVRKLRWEINLEPVLNFYRRVIANPQPARRVKHADPLPVTIDKRPAGKQWRGTYLSAAVEAVAAGSTSVLQREDCDPAIYEKWLAATVERALDLRLPSIRVEGWIEQSSWLEATHMGYAAGLASHLRRLGLPVSDLVVERALVQEPKAAAKPRKSAFLISDEQIRKAEATYAGSYESPAIGYANVRDYCDSTEAMPALTRLQDDLKGVQWPWAIKAILGKVPRGSRLLEIGAGEPLIADILSRTGYEVWIADPYRGDSPLLRYMSECPDVRFLRDTFSDELMDIPPASFDCIYSVSVLEQIEEAVLHAALRGISRFLKPSGMSIHAIEYVHRGMGHKEDLRRLELLSRAFGIEDVELRSTLQRLDRDVDVYTLSAESFNERRGSRPYDEFRMRKWVSIQLVTSARNAVRIL